MSDSVSHAAVIGRCERCESPLERGDLRCAICGMGAPHTGDMEEVLSIQVLRCEGCGAAVAYDAAIGAPNCSFCGSVMRLDELVDPPEQTGGYLPFRVDRAEAQAHLKKWLGNRGFFRPKDLASRSRLESLKPLFWVGWVFDAEAEVTWTADSNLGSRRSSWAPHSGAASMVFDNLLVSASRGLSSAEVDAVSDSYKLNDLESAPHSAPPGSVDLEAALVESFDVQRSLARRRIVKAIETTAAARVEHSHVPGSRCRKVHTSVLLEKLVTRRLSFPAWVLAYRYDGKLYRAVISGQDASSMTGTSPFSYARLFMVLGIVAAVVAAVSLAASLS
ncbi:MAG: hypothetical protein OSB10_00415 [Planctomycetota bacterium]|nr:hypothetical protein [Planctomycetota bacterium]